MIPFYSPPKTFEALTMVMAITYNENRKAEMRGERGAVERYEFYSKARGGIRTKIKKGPVVDEWKKEIVERSIELRQMGPGQAIVNEDDMDDGILEIVEDELDRLQIFGQEDDEAMEDSDDNDSE